MALKYLLLMVLMFGPTSWALNGMSTDPLEKMCVQNGGPHAYEMFLKVEEEFFACITPTIDFMSHHSFKYTSGIYMLFKENCPAIEKATECVNDGIKEVSSCFNGQENEGIQNMGNSMKQMAEFICHDHADRVRLFAAEGGLECSQTNKEDILKCISKLNANIIDAFDQPFDDAFFRSVLKDNSFDDKECDLYKKLEECIVDPMKSCKSSTPADLVKSLFKEAFKGTPCDTDLRIPVLQDNKMSTIPLLQDNKMSTIPLLQDNKMSTGIIVLIAVVVLAILASIVVVAYKKQVRSERRRQSEQHILKS